MRSFLDWLDHDGFQTKTVWDEASHAWIGAGNLQLLPFQRRILGHCLTPGEDGLFPYHTIVYSAPKKSGKTTILAAIGAWAAECAPEGSEIYSIANDLEQAQARAFTDIVYHVEHKLELAPTRYRIDYDNETFVQAIANQYASAAGARQFMTLFDELWAYTSERSRRMWAEMTPPPSVPNAMRVVTTYAGFESESDQLMDLYDMCFKKENGNFLYGEVVPELADLVNSKDESVCRRNGDTFIYWDTEPRMPWQTAQYYSDQMMTLRPVDFLRMHRNTWVSSSESFIPVELWDRACTHLQAPLTLQKGDPLRAMPISVAIDIGMKHDCSALVGVYYNQKSRRVGVAFHRIWTPPSNGAMLDLEYTVEQEMLRLWHEFRIVSVAYDPAQFQRSAITLQRAGLPMVEFTQTAGNMMLATQSLYDLLKTDTLDAYPDPELRDHIRYASAETTSRGFRLVKGRNAKYKIDAAVCLAMATYDAISRGGVDTSQPVQIISPFSDATAVRIPTISDQMKLPAALRD